MKNLFIIAFFIFLFTVSCKEEVDCPGKSYELWISIYNSTGNDIEVNLYPKQEYLWNSWSYKPSPTSGQHKDNHFIMEFDGLESWSDRNRLYNSPDTSMKPSELLRTIFDSIIINVNNENNTELKFNHDQSVNYLENPFTNDTIWNYEKYDFSRPTNDCEGKAEIKEYIYYFEQNKIDKNYFSIFPNPSSKYVTIEVENIQVLPVVLKLNNLQGKELAIYKIKEKSSIINVSNFPNGIYLLTLINKNGELIKSEKIIKE